jgi:hypothetical protein
MMATNVPTTNALAQWAGYVTEQLGRTPRGLRDVAAFNTAGKPAVIRVASVVDGKPFPTLFWLIDPVINLAIDRLEAGGAIARLQALVDDSPELRTRMSKDHHAHKALRASFLTTKERAFLESQRMMAALDKRGIGGIAEPDRIRCLHTWYAAHWVVPNTVGSWVDEALAELEPKNQ